MRKPPLYLTILLIVLLIIFLYFFFIPEFYKKLKEIDKKEIAIKKCIEECKKALREGKNISNGPCLLDPIPELSDWVCDVAHWPREEIDNFPENQCSYFREGRAYHFVEVDTSCNLIRVY
jgi:hypothetical protein